MFHKNPQELYNIAFFFILDQEIAEASCFD